MNVLASAQSRGIAKGFGMGMAVVLLASAGLYGWASVTAPAIRKAIEEKTASRTIAIERVLPINPPIDRHAAAETPAPVPGDAAFIGPVQPTASVIPESHTAQQQEPAHAVTPPAGEHAAEAHAPETAGHEAEPEHPAVPAEDEALKDVKKYANGMCIAPVEGLYEETAAGSLPVMRNDGLTAFKAYRKPFVPVADKPIISIAIADMGLSANITDEAIRSLPPEVTLIISPYADDLVKVTNDSRAAGHEVWMMLPMETATYPKSDPGPHTMLIGAPERENQQKLDWIMSRTIGYAGLVASYQPEFLSSVNDARPVLGTIFKRGVGFVDSRSAAGSTPETMALSMNAPFTSIDVWIDKPENSSEIINASLKQMELIAKERGYAAGVISPSQVSFREVVLWLETLKDKGFVLAPLSAQTGY